MISVSFTGSNKDHQMKNAENAEKDRNNWIRNVTQNRRMIVVYFVRIFVFWFLLGW